jgi:hypothetical protein
MEEEAIAVMAIQCNLPGIKTAAGICVRGDTLRKKTGGFEHHGFKSREKNSQF